MNFTAEAMLREKIAQAEAVKAAKAARERELQKNLERENELRLLTGGGESQDTRRRALEEAVPDDKITGNAFVDGYLKSQSELRAKMVRDAEDILLSESDFQGAHEDTNEHNLSPGKLSKKEKKKKKKHLLDGTAEDTLNANQFPTESEILSKLPPIDPDLLKEFENFQYDVNPSPVQPSDNGDIPNSYNKETESTNNLKSLSTLEEKPRKIDWGDSDDELDDQSKAAEQAADIISQQLQVISESTVDLDEPLTTVVISSEDVAEEPEDSSSVAASAAAHREVDEAELEKYIKDIVPNLNGNFDREGQFREWHETLTVDSYKGEPLHILPYTIIDF